MTDICALSHDILQKVGGGCGRCQQFTCLSKSRPVRNHDFQGDNCWLAFSTVGSAFGSRCGTHGPGMGERHHGHELVCQLGGPLSAPDILPLLRAAVFGVARKGISILPALSITRDKSGLRRRRLVGQTHGCVRCGAWR